MIEKLKGRQTASNIWETNEVELKINEIIDVVNLLTQEKEKVEEWKPEDNITVWGITGAGEVERFTWNSSSDWRKKKKEFMGVYPTRKQAEAALLKIKEVLKGI